MGWSFLALILFKRRESRGDGVLFCYSRDRCVLPDLSPFLNRLECEVADKHLY